MLAGYQHSQTRTRGLAYLSYFLRIFVSITYLLRLFYGKNTVFQIWDIIEAATMKFNRIDLASLNVFQKLVTNQHIDWIDRNESVIQHLEKLVQKQKTSNDMIDEKKEDNTLNYGEQLFGHFCTNESLKWIGIRNIHSIPTSLKKLLINDDDEYPLSFIELSTLFPNCEKIILTDINSKTFTVNCEKYIMCVIKYIEYVNNMNVNMKDSVNKIILESIQEIESKPNPTLNKFSKIYSSDFAELNWTIEYDFKLETHHSLSFVKSTPTKSDETIKRKRTNHIRQVINRYKGFKNKDAMKVNDCISND